MSTKFQRMQTFIRYYKDQTGVKEVDMHEVARFAKANGWTMPKPADPVDVLAKEFSKAARDEIRHDKKTGRPYRANHAYSDGPNLFTLWVDIDEAPRKPMVKSLINRREQMVSDGLLLTLDADHWNGIHPDEEPIVVPMDFTDDIEWRKNSLDEEADAA